MKPVAIFSSDESEVYLPFVEPVSRAWENLGFEPMCISVTHENCFVPTDEIPTGNQAQMVRALIPALYPNRMFIVADVDMLPLNKMYFTSILSLLDSDKKIVNVSADAYPGQLRFPMCYYAGYGAAFSAVTGVKNTEDIGRAMRLWWKKNHGWETDELCFANEVLTASNESRVEVSLYKRGWQNGRAIGRIDRDMWMYDSEALSSGLYIDSHMLRPLKEHRDHLKPLFASIGVVV